MARTISEALVEFGVGTNKEPSAYTTEEVDTIFGVSSIILYFGSLSDILSIYSPSGILLLPTATPRLIALVHLDGTRRAQKPITCRLLRRKSGCWLLSRSKLLEKK